MRNLLTLLERITSQLKNFYFEKKYWILFTNNKNENKKWFKDQSL